jgi:hypothetical protein
MAFIGRIGLWLDRRGTEILPRPAGLLATIERE